MSAVGPQAQPDDTAAPTRPMGKLALSAAQHRGNAESASFNAKRQWRCVLRCASGAQACAARAPTLAD
eukprot:7205909-Alexandrium_andersonii.AAC.1